MGSPVRAHSYYSKLSAFAEPAERAGSDKQPGERHFEPRSGGANILNERCAATLKAAMNRIVPEDEFPNAWDAGVGDYIERLLARELSPIAEAYAATLLALDTEAFGTYGTGFPELNESEQDALLRRVEAGDVQGEWPIAPREFFSLLVSHCAEGYYSDPENGGNRDRVSWQMIGFVERGSVEA